MRPSFSINEASWHRVEVGLKNIAARVPDNARKTMRRTAERIVRKAKMYVPEDTGALMESIRLEVGYGPRGRLEIRVVVGGEGEIMVNGRTINVDQYAAIIHEHYESMLVNGPGDRTEEKMALYGRDKVGSRFLTRAYDEERTLLDRDMIEGVKQIIKSEGMA
jgi:hypothetical protein